MSTGLRFKLSTVVMLAIASVSPLLAQASGLSAAELCHQEPAHAANPPGRGQFLLLGC